MNPDLWQSKNDAVSAISKLESLNEDQTVHIKSSAKWIHNTNSECKPSDLHTGTPIRNCIIFLMQLFGVPIFPKRNESKLHQIINKFNLV